MLNIKVTIGLPLYHETLNIHLNGHLKDGEDGDADEGCPEREPEAVRRANRRRLPIQRNHEFNLLLNLGQCKNIVKTSLSEVAKETKSTEATEWQTTKSESTGLERVAAKCATAVTEM